MSGVKRKTRVREHQRSNAPSGVREHERALAVDPRDVFAQRYRETKTDPDVRDQLDHYAERYVELVALVGQVEAGPALEAEMAIDESHGDYVYVTREAVEAHAAAAAAALASSGGSSGGYSADDYSGATRPYNYIELSRRKPRSLDPLINEVVVMRDGTRGRIVARGRIVGNYVLRDENGHDRPIRETDINAEVL